MDNELKLLLNQYVHSVASLKAVRSWISENIWDAQLDIRSPRFVGGVGWLNLIGVRIDGLQAVRPDQPPTGQYSTRVLTRRLVTGPRSFR